MSIVDMSVKRPVTILVITLLFTGLAVFMVPDLAVEMFPSTDMPIIMVATSYSNASPEEVEDGVTTLIERQLSNIGGLKNITSTSSEGRSSIRLEFNYGTNLDEATNDIRDSLERVTRALPDGASSPQIIKFDSSGRPIMRLLVTGKETSDTLTRLAEDNIQPMLERIEGVASAEVSGGANKEIKVELSLNRLQAYGLALSDITSALSSQNVLLSGGKLEKDGMQYKLRINEQFASLDEIRRAVITNLSTGSSVGTANRSNVVRLEDVADVYLGEKESSRKVYINGEPGIYIQIMNESDTNIVQIAEAVKEKLPEINATLPSGVAVEILYDSTTMISSLLNALYSSAIQGGLLAMLIILLFLRNIKSTLVIGISIPVSVFITMGAMYFFNITLNMVSLTGLILGVGMVVDNSIVILDNIYKYRERGVKLTPSAILGSREMVTAISASTLTTICVFIPMIIWKNKLEMIGQMFQDLIFTIVLSLLISLVVALTVVPALCSHYLKLYSRRQKPLKNSFIRAVDTFFEKMFTSLENGYTRGVKFALQNRAIVLTLVGVLFLLSLTKFSTMGMQFQPSSDSDDSVTVNLTMPIGTSLDRTETVLQEMRSIIEKEIKGYKNLILTAGSGNANSYRGSIEITLPDLQNQIDNPTAIKKKLQPYLTQFPDAAFAFSAGRMGGGRNPVDIEIISSDLTLAGKTAAEIRDLIRQLPHVKDPVSSLESGAPEYRIVVNKEQASALGLTVARIASVISSYINGVTPVTYWMDGEELDITVQLKEADRDSLPDLESLFILTPGGGRIALANLASFQFTTGPRDIGRENDKRVLHVTSGIAAGVTATQVIAEVKAYLDAHYVVPNGVTLSYGGEAREISRIGAPLIVVIIVAIIITFGVMACLFESFIDPFIIFFSIPQLLIGVVAVYTLLGQSLSLYSVVGMVVLVGIVVNNGIVMVDYTNLLRHKGIPLMEACVEAARNRLRPVLMTSLTTILGAVPMAFFPAEGTETIQTIGLTIVGGMVASTVLTLFVTPVVYSLANRDRKVFRKKAREMSAIPVIMEGVAEKVMEGGQDA